MQSQNTILSASAAMIQEKAVTFAKELNVENIQTSDGRLRRWKERKKPHNFQDCIKGMEICYTRNS